MIYAKGSVGVTQMTKKNKDTSVEILTGVISPVKWEGDMVSEVALFATDDEAYRIENGDKFIDMLQQCVEAVGRVRRDTKAFRSINIKKFKVVESV